MAKTNFQTVDDYISSFPKDVQAGLEKIRKAVSKVVPEAEEVISYQIPAFKFHGMLVYFSAYKEHYSLTFPPPFTVFEVFKKELSDWELSKTTVKFPMNKSVPIALVTKMVKFRAKEMLKRNKSIS